MYHLLINNKAGPVCPNLILCFLSGSVKSLRIETNSVETFSDFQSVAETGENKQPCTDII